MVKTKYDVIRALIIKNLISETGLSERFVRMAVKGERDSTTADTIKKEFKKRYDIAAATLKPNSHK